MRLLSSLWLLALFLNVHTVVGEAAEDAKADASTVLKQVDLKPTIKWQHDKAGNGEIAPVTMTDLDGKPTATLTSIPAATAIARQNVSLSFTIPLQAENEGEYLDIDGYCWYPVSGFYGRLSRILFYTTMLFALFARRHQWLIIGALAASMTYAGTAAIHAFVIIWGNSAMGNNDMYAILGVLLFSSAMIIPLLTWSKTIKDIGRRHHEEDSIGRSIIIAWGLLIFVGFITIFVGSLVGRVSNNVGEGSYHVYSPALSTTESIMCTPENNELDLTAGQDPGWSSMYVTQEFIEENRCTNPCTKLQYPTILKSAESLKALSSREVGFWLEVEANIKHEKVTYRVLIAVCFGGAALLFAILQALTILLFGRRSPTEVRNKVYLTLRSWFMDHDHTSDDDSNEKHRTPSFFAKGFAYLFYAWGVAAAIISIILVVGSIVTTEFMMAALPQSDEDFEVDQWASWVATGLVLLVAALYRFEGIFEDLLMRFLNNIMEGMHSCVHGCPKNKCEWHSHRNEKEARGMSNVSIVEKTFQESIGHYWNRFTTWPSTWHASWEDSKSFYQNPIKTATERTGKSHNRPRKVVNLEGQRFPDRWDADDWLRIDEFIDMVRKYDRLHREDPANKTAKGYKWQPRVILDDGVTDAVRTTFNRALLKDLFSRHKEKSQTHKSETGSSVHGTTSYAPVSGSGKDFEPDSEEDDYKGPRIISETPLGESHDYNTSTTPDTTQRQRPESTVAKRSSRHLHVSELTQNDIQPIHRRSTAPISQYSALRNASPSNPAASDMSPDVPAHIRHAATFQDRPRRPLRQPSTSPALSPNLGIGTFSQRGSSDVIQVSARQSHQLQSQPAPAPQPTRHLRASTSIDKTLPELPVDAVANAESWIKLGERDSFVDVDVGNQSAKKPNVSPMTVTRAASAQSWIKGDDPGKS